MSYIRLSSGSSKSENEALSTWLHDPPSLLVSYMFLKDFYKTRSSIGYRDWVLDSGAFTAWNSGKPIDVYRFMDDVHRMLQEDKDLPAEIFSLDVIGDPVATLKNAVLLRDSGLDVIPTWHAGEPKTYLKELAATFPKIAVGGMAGGFQVMTPTRKRAICDEVFNAVWPKLIHGFGVGGPEALLELPFDSSDASNWAVGPMAWATWAYWNEWQDKISIPTSHLDLRCEIHYYLKMEALSELAFRHLLEPLRQEYRKRPRLQYKYELKAPAAEPEPVRRKARENRPTVLTGKMEDRWVDYWKNRL